jgi:hypothetical protein
MDSFSPLRFITFDVSRYLYETFFTSQETKNKYNNVMEEYKMLRQTFDYKDHYTMSSYGYIYKTCRIRQYYTSNEFLKHIKNSYLLYSES